MPTGRAPTSDLAVSQATDPQGLPSQPFNLPYTFYTRTMPNTTVRFTGLQTGGWRNNALWITPPGLQLPASWLAVPGASPAPGWAPGASPWREPCGPSSNAIRVSYPQQPEDKLWSQAAGHGSGEGKFTPGQEGSSQQNHKEVKAREPLALLCRSGEFVHTAVPPGTQGKEE